MQLVHLDEIIYSFSTRSSRSYCSVKLVAQSVTLFFGGIYKRSIWLDLNLMCSVSIRFGLMEENLYNIVIRIVSILKTGN